MQLFSDMVSEGMKILIAVISGLVVIGIMIVGWIIIEAYRNEDALIACPMDAKLCSDGSYVSRVPPNCAFASCPGEMND